MTYLIEFNVGTFLTRQSEKEVLALWRRQFDFSADDALSFDNFEVIRVETNCCLFWENVSGTNRTEPMYRTDSTETGMVVAFFTVQEKVDDIETLMRRLRRGDSEDYAYRISGPWTGLEELQRRSVWEQLVIR